MTARRSDDLKAAPQREARNARDWWRGAVIYQVYPRSFQDTDGDGIGDLAGLQRRLPYIAGLGVDAVWICPFFRSPQQDFGYDISGFREVDEVFGTMEDFDSLLAEARRLGLKIVVDLVLSHTATTHPWFVESRQSRDNARADWYIWADPRPDGTAPNNWLSMFGGPAWRYSTARGQYYLHQFLPSQPDLNFHNRDVQDAILDMVRFWLERGVDGIRLDTVNFYFHDKALRDNPALPPEGRSDAVAPLANPYTFQDHRFDKSQPETIPFLERLRALADEFGHRALLGEVGDGQRGKAIAAEYTAGGRRLHMCYDFDFLAPEPPTPDRVRAVIRDLKAHDDESWQAWAFSNHDVVRHSTRWAKDDPARIKTLAALLMCLRGSVCIYQGEELGLPQAHLARKDLRDPYGLQLWPEVSGRDGARTPMPWASDAPNLGFTGAETSWLPVPADHRAFAVDLQEGRDDSVLAAYRRLIAARRDSRALRKGGLKIEGSCPELVVFSRCFEDETILCAFNLTEAPAACAAPFAAAPLEGLRFGGRLIDDELRVGPWDAFIGAAA